MKQITKYAAIIILTVVVCVLVMRSCGPGSKEILPTETKEVRAKESEIVKEKQVAKIIHDTVIAHHHHYYTVRRDSLIPCETKLVLCDTIIVKDSTLIMAQDVIIADQDSVIKDWHIIHVQDSTSLVRANKEVKKERRKKIFWQFVSGVEAVLNSRQVFK